MRRKIPWIVALASLAISIPIVAFGGGGGGTVNFSQTVGGGQIETASDNWQLVGEVPVEHAIGGSLSVRVAGEAYALDYGSGGVFKGEKYAAMKVRLKLGANPTSAFTFADNRGVVGSSNPKALLNAGEWGSGLGGNFTVKLQMKSLNPKDQVGFKRWVMSVTYGKTPP